MAVKLEKSLEREIRVYGVEGPVIVTIAPEGLEFRLPGSRKTVTISWTNVVGEAETPATVPSYLMGKPLEFLQQQAREIIKRREGRDGTS